MPAKLDSGYSVPSPPLSQSVGLKPRIYCDSVELYHAEVPNNINWRSAIHKLQCLLHAQAVPAPNHAAHKGNGISTGSHLTRSGAPNLWSEPLYLSTDWVSFFPPEKLCMPAQASFVLYVECPSVM